jgi:hypothetical protein
MHNCTCSSNSFLSFRLVLILKSSMSYFYSSSIRVQNFLTLFIYHLHILKTFYFIIINFYCIQI